MGAWGTGIFEDDTACDVRNEYIDLLTKGVSDEEATRRVLETFAYDANDEDHAVMFWTALAATQCRVGRLDESVKAKVISLLAEGDSPLWQEAEDCIQERAAVLDDLKNQLCSSQPPRMDKAALIAYRAELFGEGLQPAEGKPEPRNGAMPQETAKKWWEFWK